MSGNLSLHAGYDVGYLTDAVGSGAVDYYLSSAGKNGEPPGIWMGRGARDLGLSGQVNAGVMRALYHRDEGPDGPLNTRQGQAAYKTGRGQLSDRIDEAVAAAVAGRGAFVTAEEIADIRLRERAKVRNAVPFFDFTFSAAKSVSVAHASYVAAAIEARNAMDYDGAREYEAKAEAIMAAMRETAEVIVASIERKAAYTRTGHHSANTGEWRDAKGVTAAAFVQRTSRDGDPQLHVHIAVLNRVQRADGVDDRYRTLDSKALHRERLGIAAIASRVLDQKLAGQGFRMVARADGNGAEIGGVTDGTMRSFSSRRAAITPEVARLAREYEAMHGHAPSRRTLWSLRQWATLQTRKGKHEVSRSPAEDLAAWTEQANREESQALADVHKAIAGYGAVHGPAPELSTAERERCARIAVAEVQRQNATWTVSQLLLELHRALPPLPAETDPTALLESMAAGIVTGRTNGTDVVPLAPAPDPVDVSMLDMRASDGESVYRPTGRARYATTEQLDTEKYLLDSATAAVPQLVTTDQAEAVLAGTDLDRTQRTVAEGLLAAERLISVFVAPAGTGKSHTVAVFASAWARVTGGRVIGLTTSTNAARVLADEGLDAAHNIAHFLGKIKDSDETRGNIPVHRGDVLVVDEASQVSTNDLLRITIIARQVGARVILTGDTAQLASPENGGMMRLIAHDHGHWQLHEVRRFNEKWEQRASLKLRRGDIASIGAYKARGRVRSGPQNVAHERAVGLWITDFVRGKETLLLAGSNEEAAELARQARERLVSYGVIPGRADITLGDGNEAGTGDLIRARLNTKIDAGGQTLSNRDTIRIEGWQGAGKNRDAVAVRQTAPGQWSRPFLVPAAYLQESAELAYAGNTHVAQGRTVDTGHLVVSDTIGRESLYVGMTRGREANTAHVVTGPAERPGKKEADQQAPAEAILAAAMTRDTAGLTATETIRESQAAATNARYLMQIWSVLTRESSFRAADEGLKARLPEAEYRRYAREPERHALYAQLRSAELAGHDVASILDRATVRDFHGANSVSKVLHGRISKLDLPERTEPVKWAERVPAIPDPQRASAVEEAASAMDARVAELGTMAADKPPAWACRYLGVPPREAGALRDDWINRVGQVAFYREAAGIDDPQQAVGPAPAGNPELRQQYLASVTALEMTTEEAEVKAAPQRDLEARVRGYAREAAHAPASVAPELQSAAEAEADTREQIEAARLRNDSGLAWSGEALVSDLAGRREALSEVQAVRDEWAEATAQQQAQARLAAAELANRGVEPEIEPEAEAEPAPVIEAPAGDVQRQLEQARQAAVRLQAGRTPEIEPEADQAARELAQAEAEASEAEAWQDGAAVTPPAPETEGIEV